MHELYKKYRPKMFKEVVGNEGVIQSLSTMIEQGSLPHSILFTGPSGCGKTTLARIIARKLKCSKHDISEVNCADFRGIDMVRDIRSQMRRMPIASQHRMWIIDEAHKLSNDAQNAFLKILEDTPQHVYFVLATTDPNKLLQTIRTRTSIFAVKALNAKECQVLLERIPEANDQLDEDLRDALIEAADGSARKLLVLLQAVLSVADPKQRYEMLVADEAQKQAIEIARELISPKPSWPKIAKLIKEVTEEPETIRWMILGYASTILLGGGKLAPRAYLLINSFRDNFFDSKKAGLIAACYEVVHGG